LLQSLEAGLPFTVSQPSNEEKERANQGTNAIDPIEIPHRIRMQRQNQRSIALLQICR
jgi:hypothetical protein